ncbi:ABC transporter substrate-binding protein [Salipiger bermudensis]|uniref:ABC transporter substrate-binding protein n=1 Tax=Salipiger bermudensis TaxID=344736 RepID=UPI00067FE2F2|nr:ABC transporter substrate-binding protein [Salipiger bermudensis]
MDDTRRRLRGLPALPGLALTASLTLGATTASAQELVWARYGDIDSLDPHRATSTLSMQVWDQIYDTLLAFDMEGNPGPNMAASWEASEDGLEYTFTLNEGIMCHDGTPFDANDVKFTIDRAFGDTPSLTKTSWGPITDVTVVDPLTFKVTLASKFGAFLPFLADSFSSMICDSNTAETFGSTTAIGTGPFSLDEWVKGSEVALSKNPDYVNYGEPYDNEGAPHIDRLLIRTVPEAQTRLAALRTGEVHIAEPPFDDIEAIKEAGELEIMVAENTGQDVFWEFTTSRAPFDDIRARQAVAYATDPQMAIDIIYGGLTNREWCPVARGVFGNDQEFCKQYGYEYDPEKAKALLAEMGYGPDNPLETTMFVWTGGNRHKLAEIFQSQLAQVGIDAGVEIMDIGTMNARVKAQNEDTTSDEPGTFDMMTWSWYDPDILYQLWHSPGAYSGYQSPELDAMLEETRTTIDPDARLEKVQAVIKYLMENAVHIGLYSPGWEWVFAVRPEVEGFKVGPFLHPNFLDVTVVSGG